MSAVLYFRVVDPNRALVAVENYLSQTTLRSVCGEAELDQLLAEREKINVMAAPSGDLGRLRSR